MCIYTCACVALPSSVSSSTLGHRLSILLHTKACFPPLNCEVQQFIFTGAWWLVNGCEDSSWAMIHGLSRAHLGVSFCAPYHYKSFYIITAGNGKCFVTMWRERMRITDAGLFHTIMKSVCCKLLHWMPAMSLCDVEVLLLVCLLPFIIVHVFLWDCCVLVSMGFFVMLPWFLEQGSCGTKAAEAKINSSASNNVLPATSAFIK